MSFERTKLKLGDIVDIFTGYPFKSAQYSENPGDIKLIRGDNIAQGVLRWDGVKRWPVDETDKLDSFWLKENDVLLAMDRPWIPAGLKFARVYSSDLPCLLVQRVACLRAKNGQDQNFIYSLLSTPAFSEYIQNVTTGTAVPHISVKQIKEFELEKLTLSDEREIGLFHGIIDSRIKSLRETNTTLEAIAQALFKSWFVDFDPVHANAGTQAPSLPAEIQALFPSRLVESSQGLIPEGWEVGVFRDIAQQKKGSVNPLKTPDQIFEHYSLPAFDNNQTPVLSPGELIKSNKTPLPENAVLLSKLNPHIPRVWLPLEYGKNAVCSTEFLAYSPINGASKEFIFTLFSSSAFLMNLQQLVTGTSNSHQRVKPDQILDVGLVIPSVDVLREFEKVTNPIFSRIGANRAKSQTLANLRDTLLPRLISGQLRLPEAEAVLADYA